MSDVADKPIPLYQKITAAVVFVAMVVTLVFFHGRLGADFYPLDASRIAPNIIASVIQWIAVAGAAVLIWPPTRRRIHRFADAKLGSIHSRLDSAKDHRDKLEAKLNHIIKHSKDIPEFES